MRVTTKCAWIFAALAASGMMPGGRAEAGTAISKGITLKGGVTQGGDPQFTYYLDVFLIDDTIPAYASPGPATASVTLDGITGISSIDTYQINYKAYVTPEAIWNPNIQADSATIDYFGYGASTATGPDPLFLFQLVIITPPDTPAGLIPGDSFTYTYTIGTGSDQETGGGTVVVGQGAPAVPEPTSIVLMLAGGTVIPYAGLRHRRGRRSGGAA